jgi:hypothetical protein
VEVKPKEEKPAVIKNPRAAQPKIDESISGIKGNIVANHYF